ncbi:MAG TPA: pilus assembly PilX N-terminal domain-containing protein, partial [Pyrinomonadaceae bacterium]|nr:pilus assembly PilX N-terminal domain-containing protein [Pyrinomonadaceae bacterium]
MSFIQLKTNHPDKNVGERGAALAIAIIVVAILLVIALTALAFSSTEARIAGSDLQRTQTFYATSAALEKMTNDFSNLFRKKMKPNNADLQTIVDSPPQALKDKGFSFVQTLSEDTDRLNELRAIQGLPNTVYPRVNIPEGPYAGLYSSIIPYKLSSTATMQTTKVEVELEREFNNYLVPLFQFGIYSNEDLEFSPGPLMTFNGRVHSNRNIYAMRNIKFLNRVSMAGELVRRATRGGEPNTGSGSDNVWFEVGGINVQSTEGSVKPDGNTSGGPNFAGSVPGQRGYHPGSPNGAPNPNWESESVKPANGSRNRFGGQVLTNTTGANELKTPLELAGNSPAELIKRSLPSDGEILASSRYHNKSQIRILIDDESVGSGTSNVAGIPAGKGVLLSAFMPSHLGGGNVLRKIDDSTGAVSGSMIQQENPNGSISPNAAVVRAVKSLTPNSSFNYVPPGSGIQGRILIEIVKPDGTTVDVTQEILSMGVTVGEPNGIIYLQRPLWAAFVQGSRDRSGNFFDLVKLTKDSTQHIADGEIANPTAFINTARGFITANSASLNEDSGNLRRSWKPPAAEYWNAIVPINVYNVREGWVRNTLPKENVYLERGV